MMLKLWVLSLGILLIALSNVQLTQSTSLYYFHEDQQENGWGNAQPQRHHQNHHYHDQNGYGSDHVDVYDPYRYPESEDQQFGGDYDDQSGLGLGVQRPFEGFGAHSSYGPQQPNTRDGGFRAGPGFGAAPGTGFIDQPTSEYGGYGSDRVDVYNPYGYFESEDQPFGGDYDDQSSLGLGVQRPFGGFGTHSSYGPQQPNTRDGGFRAGPGFGAAPGTGFIDQPTSGYDGGRTFQPRPGQPQQPDQPQQGGYPIQPRPPAGSYLPPRPGQGTTRFQQPSDVIFQPRPGHETTDSTAFDALSINSLQPSPQQRDLDASEFNFQSSGNPGQTTNGFQQSGPELTGKTIQPRPQPEGRDASEFTVKTPGNADVPLQPRPIFELTDSSELLQPSGGQSGILS